MNPAKLKVVELRAELSARGLDSKGIKAVLVERLQEALDKEEGNEGGDRSRKEEGDSSEEQTDAQGPTETSEQEHGSESETEPSQKTPSKVDPSPPEGSPKPEINEAPAKEEPVDDEAAPDKTESTPQKSREPTPQKTPPKAATPQKTPPKAATPQKTPPKAATPQKTPPKAATPQKTSPLKPSVEEGAEMDVDEKPKDHDDHDAAEGKDDALDEKMEAEEESDVKEEPDDSEYSKHQNEENGVKEGYEQDVKSEVKTEDDIKTESDVKSEPSETRESRKRRRSTTPTSPRSRGQGKTYDREPDIKDSDVTLSWYDSDLNLTIDDKTFMSATPMSDGGFGYVWAGVRGTHGYTSGSLCYQVKVTNFLDVAHLEDEPNPNVLRVGWSAFSTSLQLGEEPFSYGYGGTGKFAVDCKFSNFGKPFSLNDVITCYLEFTNDEVVMSFGLNDEYLGVAQRIPVESLDGKALAPHILTKNSSFSVNFGQEEVPWSQVQENYVFLNKYPIEEAVPGPRRPEKRSDCEMVMMCGLPGCGKTVWVTKYAAEHPEKNYTILGTNFLIDKMKVMGLPRKANYHGRWDVLIEKCTKCLQRLMDIGSHRRRNYILDQTNVYPAAQRRKMRNFEGFTRKAVVIVPTDEEFKSRVEKQAKEEKKDVPEIAVLEMKANFTLPDKNLFDEVNYIELQEEEAQALIQKYAKEAADKGVFPKSGPPGPHSKRFRGGDYHHPKNDFRRDRFSSGPPSSPFRRGSDRGGPRGGGGGRGGRGGSGPMDRWRDNRNQGGYGRPPQGDRQGWRGPPSGPPGGNGRGPRDFDRGPPRGGYDRNSRSGPPQRPGSGYNSRDNSRDHQRGPPGGPKQGMGGKPRPGDAGKPIAGGGPQSAPPAQWNNQYQNQGQQAAAPNQAWGQQAQWNNANAQAWNNYQQQWKGYQQGYNQQGYSQGYNPQQYNNWQQYYGQYNAQGGWGQNSDGTYNYPQSWQSWYAPQNAGQTNTTQPPPTAK